MRTNRTVKIKNVHTGIVSINGLVLNPGDEQEIDCTMLREGSVQTMLRMGMLKVIDGAPDQQGRA